MRLAEKIFVECDHFTVLSVLSLQVTSTDREKGLYFHELNQDKEQMQPGM